ncbi:NitT/TauT family transport system permease protein [Rhizomicrobium palustre]|uniref:NitT/TauT family transport system permease protein n=1 Tax=Rhizomicrobium palustre TaxID=189966 RepID=A0A846MVP8_9PROT|nr:ABC transporter permease subunit [Rhizomicrobium palustre]NIK87446.1 NitT/TauT family transport system permease protein [Rhizomicrobium palustre]
MKLFPPVSVETRRFLPRSWDLLAGIFVLGAIIFFAEASREVIQPLTSLAHNPISLDPANLPNYAFRTALRMLAAMVFSLLFTFTYATWAAKSQRASVLLVPLLDILQSVPILGFISVTVVFFLSLAPGKVLGAEIAAVFAIFTSQAWNMAFSFYQSLRTVPVELTEAGKMFGLTGWGRFWRIEAPFAMPPLVWNMMMSMSGGWFFVVAAEAISVGHTSIVLPGIGSYIAAAIEAKSLIAITYAIGAMLVVIVIFDQLLFRPLVAWADRFRIDSEPSDEEPESWALTMFRRSQIFDWLGRPFDLAMRWSWRIRPLSFGRKTESRPSPLMDAFFYAVLIGLSGYILWQMAGFAGAAFNAHDLTDAALKGLATFARVVILIALASLIWTPIGIYVGLRPHLAQVIQPIAQFLAAFPANLVFPVAVSLIVFWNLNPDIWLSPLMVLGTQWYILFNVIAGASALPRELKDAASNFQVRGWLWWKKVGIPAVMPYYVTGAITASGGSWNAAIVAEVVSWGSKTLHAYGLGAYIADATSAGDFHRIVVGVCVMSFYVVVLNRLFWRPLYWYAERKFRMT